MATNNPVGNGHRNGAVRDRSQVFNPVTEQYVKRNTGNGQFMDVKQDGTPFKGVRKGERRQIILLLLWFSSNKKASPNLEALFYFNYLRKLMQVSRRHHYIPQFLIKNFADEDGLLYLLDKQTSRIAKQRQSPKSIFFEMGRNTVLFDGQPKDHLEALYAALDDQAAADLHNVLQTRKASPEEVVSIVALANSLKWRVPASDLQFGLLKEKLSLADLKAEIRPIDPAQPVDQTALNQLETSDAIKEAKRILLPLLPLFNEDKLTDIHASWFIHSHAEDRFPSIIGDCPLLEKPNADYNKLDDFIFPLSSTDTFIL